MENILCKYSSTTLIRVAQENKIYAKDRIVFS